MPFFYIRGLFHRLTAAPEKVRKMARDARLLQESVRFLLINKNTSNNNHYHLHAAL